MKRFAKRLAAVVLASILMLTTLTGCMDYMMDDYYSQLMDSYYGDYSTGGYDTTGNADPTDQSATVLTSNMLGEAIREQFTDIRGNGKDTATVMIYMCASDLESSGGYATKDLQEMIRATYDDNVNIIIETGGCSKWNNSNISASTNQRHVIKNGKFDTVEENLGRRGMTTSETLTDFIAYSAKNYPADRYMLILWDHGAGSVEGWGYDEYNYNDTLTIDELGEALYNAGVKFDFIGFDACLMSTMEVACVLYDFADYMIASEDYESAYGWEYENWLSALAKNPSISTPELGKMICDDYIVESGSTAAILSTIDLSYMKLVYTAWKEFAYAAQDQLLDANFSWQTENTNRYGRSGFGDILGSFYDLFGDFTEAEINDMMAIANAVDNVEEAEALIAALEDCIIYSTANSADAYMTGMAVTLPYGDRSAYQSIQEYFGNAGFESEYIDFLGKFVSVGGSSYSWDDWYDAWGGWDDYDSGSDYGWDDWSGWDDYYSGSNDSYSSFFDDYFGSGNGSGGNDSFNDFSDYYDNYYDNYDYSDYGFGYSDYYGSDNYYDYYDNYYDYYYGGGNGSGYGSIWDYIFGF